MGALRKPHRVAFIAPDVTVDGPDAPYEAEAALLVWSACIEACRRHPLLAVYDAESTPLVPQDGHFAPQHAALGATPTDAFYASTRRDELVWLELALPKGAPVRLHTLARDGKRESFDSLGRNLGEQIHQVLGSWLAARGIGGLPKRFDAVSADEVLGVVRVLGPVLAEQARVWAMPAPPPVALVEEPDESEENLIVGLDAEVEDTMRGAPVGAKLSARSKAARALANRLPAHLKVAALRVVELALREDLSDVILAADPDHPQSLFARFLAGVGQGKDFALLRRVIAGAPAWARPYGELVDDDRARDDDARKLAPSDLETLAGAGMAALCRPAQFEVIDTAAHHLRDDGRIDEAIRLVTHALQLHDHESRVHISLLHLHRSTDRIGAWLEQAHRLARIHGCPMDRHLPWYPDQIQIDLLVADALLNAGRLDEAIALRGNRLEGREANWPRHARILGTWRKDPRFVAWSYAREGWFRGDPARAVEGFGRIEPDDAVDLAVFLDALVTMGREDEVAFAWGQFGLGRKLGTGVSACRRALPDDRR